ncbi:hypothetical protein [Bacteroides sp.]|uniref:hypothetical protein n=1 Tax=Bacteroides sp. TaxID=29523 RepID=UPI002622A1B8|nr:hypothetical protein [Bacteroides sp.]MDD3039582.1 hypothetical protein [Bacteroides sp.]
MRNLLRPARVQALELLDSIKTMIMSTFNKDVYGVYEGIVEVFDENNYRADVRVPELSDLMLTEVRIVQPFYASASNFINIPIQVGTHVIIAFRSFKLRNPIIIGQIVDENSTNSIEDATSIVIQNGSAKIELTSTGSVILTGTTITANGEDITVDEVT